MDKDVKEISESEYQGMLFELPAAEPSVRVAPWRHVELDFPIEDERDLDRLLAAYFDLLRRDRQFLQALDCAQVSADDPSVVRFLETETTIVLYYAALRSYRERSFRRGPSVRGFAGGRRDPRCRS